MSRYYFYVMCMSMMIHTILFIPRVNVDERYDGAVMSLFVGPLIGSILMIIFTRAMMKFDGKGLPEIAAYFLPQAFRIPLMLLFGLASLTAGGLIWIHCAFIMEKYLNPDMALPVLLTLFVIMTCLSAVQSSKTVLFGTEIIFVLAVPLLVLVLIHGVFSQNMNYDSVQAMLDYAWIAPSWNSISASSYTFAGYMGLAIFNREFKNMKGVKYLWFLPMIGFGLVTASFFIPIGYLGTDGIDDYIYTWISTIDAIRMKYVFIERVITIYLLILLVMTYVFTMITWHVGSQAISSCFQAYNPKLVSWRSKLPSLVICVLLAIATVIAGSRFNEMQLFKVSGYWMRIHLPFDMLVVLIVFIWSKRGMKT
ncbi:GerAB/ArcD/ProY family transporter [Paenibacillus rhizovicinus]|uniref:GerAB/ArcD/ProY family transporter n=1 Tax=Paenibacillus rhizovicinus TaxID=2704463 RepID=A0A6C0NTR5_9BACL|nr:GerAB/ArcD/ProY family transporter [Paenibacillus rhizovicinus]QHW29609.1 GerAB/ArcD/ProY family transporter [Paenibacillus rhizovicinus]